MDLSFLGLSEANREPYIVQKKIGRERGKGWSGTKWSREIRNSRGEELYIKKKRLIEKSSPAKRTRIMNRVCGKVLPQKMCVRQRPPKEKGSGGMEKRG